MNKYYVDLDGISMITTYDNLMKGDTLSIDELGEKVYYRIREVDGKKLVLRLIRVANSVSKPTKFRYKNETDERFYFENRLSVGQSVSANGSLYKMERKEDVRGLLMVPVATKSAQVLYGVYKNRLEEGLSNSHRESVGYSAELYTTSYREAIIYVSKERSKGRKISL